MNPFLDSHVRTVIEDIRLLEAYVTAPLGLYSDLRMLRESMDLPEAANLSREETRQRREVYGALTGEPLRLALHTVSSVRCSLDILDMAATSGDSRLGAAWTAQGRRVLDRVEQRVAGELRRETALRISGLCVVVDPKATGGRPVAEVAESALRGGASVLQLRHMGGDKGGALLVGRRLREMCDRRDALLIVDADADLALSIPAHGLRLDRGGLPTAEARRVLDPEQIVGRASATVEEALDSRVQGADYIELGPVFSKSTGEESAGSPAGLPMVARVKELAALPVVAVGGITAGSAAGVLGAGADCVGVAGEITSSEDPEEAARRMVEAMALS